MNDFTGNPPPLPPRPNTDTSEHVEFSMLGKTPPAWLHALIHYSSEEDIHPHEFYLSTEFDNEVETVFLCQKCHNWFFLTIATPKANQEPTICNSENNLHHLHTTTMTRTSISANCCSCNLTVNIEIKEPFIDMRLFNDLAKLRKHSYANAVSHSEFEYKTNLVDVINKMIKIVSDTLDENLQSLKINCENFEIDKASQTLFEKLGFKLMDDCLIPPVSLSDDEKRNIKSTKEELIMLSFELNPYLKYDAKKPYEKLNYVLGTTYKTRFVGSYEKFEPHFIRSLHPSCFFLGCVSEMDDQILIWAYKLGIQEVPEKTPEYLQAIYEMCKERKSEALEELVALEKSQGKFHEDDIKDAYKCLNVGSVDVSDEMLIDTYRSFNIDYPSSRAKYRDALYIIGNARNSSKLLHFINEGPVNDVFDSFSEMPVGLDNIGNTCYLNSLLQYYFTIRPLREAVLKTDSSSANGYELDWQSITIGHRKVSKSEVERAKKFVNLLRGLFVNLIHTTQRSITPDIDLAYLALVNAKNDEDEYKETSKSPMDDNKMAIDDLSPGPSSSKNIDYGSSDNCTLSEEITVEIEGTAPSANEDFIVPKNFYEQNNESSASHSLKGKEKENAHGPELSTDFFNTSKEDKLKAASDMLLGRQQDVTECMDNVMFQLEAALKPLFMIDENEDGQNIIKRLFYGQTRQILRKQNTVVAEGRDLYDGLDVYFDASLVDYDDTQVTREVTLAKIPPILQIHVQRVQFDRSTSNIYKSNAFLRFDKVIYLDRYLDKNYELLKQRRHDAHNWKQDIDRLQAELKDYERDKTTMLPMTDLLKSTADFIHDTIKIDPTDENLLSSVEQEGNHLILTKACLNYIIEHHNKISQLKSQLSQHYRDLQECEYRLHAVFIHSGQANFGHYWIYIFDFEKDRWLKFNDSYVTEVEDREVFADTTGSSANPYCMVYVKAQDAKELVETICRQTN
ncbi:hypothetical protein C1645_814311 [Glomus cerebriforme]|uniref:Ubiquitin carboxyl-terminal hydrolase n=1 Tax=Glomus cerebriforme TaxID=658196 RepID=A0A397TJX0_9GLOM|nr:hypothetical protein C1645_814311 [Glomus cerebriforme]